MVRHTVQRVSGRKKRQKDERLWERWRDEGKKKEEKW